MAREPRDNRSPTPPDERRQRGGRGPYGPRGGMAGASDDFAGPEGAGDPSPGRRGEWSGWGAQGTHGRGAGHDRVDTRAGVDRGGESDEDLDDTGMLRGMLDADDDPDFGGRDNAAYYARYGSNQQRMEARRRWQDEHAPPDPAEWAELPEIDAGYHLHGSRRQPDRWQQAPRRGTAAQGDARWRQGAAHESHGGDYEVEPGDEPFQAWPGRDFPGGRGLPGDPWGAAPGTPGLAEPGYGSSPTRQADDHHRGRGPRGHRRSDARIVEDLCERLTEDPVVDATDVEVRCDDGVVVLEGEVETRRMKHRAEDVADACPGVLGIDNRLKVRQRGVTRAEQRSAY